LFLECFFGVFLVFGPFGLVCSVVVRLRVLLGVLVWFFVLVLVVWLLFGLFGCCLVGFCFFVL
ncbi:hypothetical protein, partial [Acinetobacter baumannii]